MRDFTALALNKAYDMVDNMRLITETYVLVGNHDYIQNQQFSLSKSLDEWYERVEKYCNSRQSYSKTIKGEKFIFVPYVPPGRFEESIRNFSTRVEGCYLYFCPSRVCRL